MVLTILAAEGKLSMSGRRSLKITGSNASLSFDPGVSSSANFP